jgi:hypothetical protein
MHDDDSAENKRNGDSVRTPVAAKKGVAPTNAPKLIDPERLSRAIRYIKEHPATPDDGDQDLRSIRGAVADDRS